MTKHTPHLVPAEDQAMLAGWQAHRSGVSLWDNPHTVPALRNAWAMGWCAADEVRRAKRR